MSFELPDGKIARTMPEQVAKNTRDIEELKTGYNEISNIAIVGGHLIVTLQDGTEYDTGAIKGIDAIAFNASRHLIVTYDDGTTADLGLIKGIDAIAFNASRHLIATYDDGTTADLGLIKGISSFSINGSQHLIATYDDGTTQDLGAIFAGNVNISGNLTADSIIENMSGYTVSTYADTDTWTKSIKYVSAVKTGNKLTLVYNATFTKTSGTNDNNPKVIRFNIPSAVNAKLIPITIGGINYLDQKIIAAFSSATSFVSIPALLFKSDQGPYLMLRMGDLVVDTEYVIRYEVTFLLNDSLI